MTQFPKRNYFDGHKVTYGEKKLVKNLLKKLIDYRIFEEVKRSDGQIGNQITEQFQNFMSDYIQSNDKMIYEITQKEAMKEKRNIGFDEYGLNMAYSTIMEYISIIKQVNETSEKNFIKIMNLKLT